MNVLAEMTEAFEAGDFARAIALREVGIAAGLIKRTPTATLAELTLEAEAALRAEDVRREAKARLAIEMVEQWNLDQDMGSVDG